MTSDDKTNAADPFHEFLAATQALRKCCEEIRKEYEGVFDNKVLEDFDQMVDQALRKLRRDNNEQ